MGTREVTSLTIIPPKGQGTLGTYISTLIGYCLRTAPREGVDSSELLD